MTWQDWILGCSGLVFAAALVPTLVWGPAPHWTTSFATACMLVGNVIALGSLRLRFSAVVTAIVSAEWVLATVEGLR